LAVECFVGNLAAYWTSYILSLPVLASSGWKHGIRWVTDRVCACKPSRYVTDHLGQLSLPSIRGR